MPADDDVIDSDAVDTETIAVLGSTIEWSWERIRSLPRNDVPRPLTPMLGFRRLSGPAQRQILRALDEDDDFRVKVAHGSGEADLPPLGALWLQRPQGWRERFESLLDEAQQRHREIARIDQERRFHRELEQLEAAIAKVSAERDRAVESSEDFRVRFEEMRSIAESLRAERNELRQRADRLESDRRRAVDELQAARALADRRLDDLRKVDAENHQDRAGSAASDPAPAVQKSSARDDDDTPAPVLNSDALAAAIDLRRQGAQAAIEARLSEIVTELVDQVNRSFADLLNTVEHEPGEPPTESVEQRSRNLDPLRRSRRQLKLPGGIFDDSIEAARHLLTAADLWLIDGYNVTMTRWSSASVEEQRHWLVRRLDTVADGVTTIRVIFDGADGDYFRGAGQRRVDGAVQVEFSPVGVEADDVILELCAAEPVEKSIVVVSDDHRVRDGARRLGANIVSVKQLFAISGAD